MIRTIGAMNLFPRIRGRGFLLPVGFRLNAVHCSRHNNDCYNIFDNTAVPRLKPMGFELRRDENFGYFPVHICVVEGYKNICFYSFYIMCGTTPD